MVTVYLTEEKPRADYSHIMDSVLLSLRKELRTDLSPISDIDWGGYVVPSTKEKKTRRKILKEKKV
jgi:hypothetical protein